MVLLFLMFFFKNRYPFCFFFFFFNDTATTEIYTLSLHDALPIFREHEPLRDLLSRHIHRKVLLSLSQAVADCQDRKSTRLNSSHLVISYAVFCLKKKKKHTFTTYQVGIVHDL